MKYLVLGLLIFLVVLLGLYLAIPWLVPLNPFRREFEKTLNEQITGKAEVSELKISTFPWLGVRMESVVLKNSKEFNQSELLRVGLAGVRIKFFPLLIGKINGEIIIEKPIIRSETLSNGKESIASIMREVSKEQKKPIEIPSWLNKILGSLQLQSLSLKKGEFRTLFINEKGNQKTGLDVHHLDLHLQDLALKGDIPFRLEGAFFNLNQPDVKLEGLLKTDIDFQQPQQLIEIKSSSIMVGDLPISLSGTLTQKKKLPLFANIKAHCDGFSLGTLAKDVPPLKEILPQDLKGDMKFNLIAKGPLTPFKDLKTELNASSNQIAVGFGQKIKITQTSLQSTFHKNRFTVHHLKALIFESQANIKGTYDLVDAKTHRANFDLTMKKINMSKAMEVFLDSKNPMEGFANLDFHVEGNPLQPATKEETLVPAWLNANGTINSGKGKFKQFNLMGDLVNALVKFAPIDPETKENLSRVTWETFSAKTQMKNGIVYVDPLIIDYGPTMVKANGRTSIKNYDYKGNFILKTSSVKQLGSAFNLLVGSDGTIQIPVTIKGRYGFPITYIDVVALAARTTKNQIKRVVPKQVQKDVQDIVKGVSDMMKKPK